MRIRLIVLAAVSALLVTLAAACGGDEETDSSGAIEPSSVTVEQDLTLADFSFDPDVIDATLGNTVVVSLANEADQIHTFTIDEFVVDEEVAAGEDSEVTFTPNEPGEFTFYCTFHPEEMQGAIRIARPGEEAPGGDVEESPTEDAGDGGGFGY